jgi:hypothetical protein
MPAFGGSIRYYGRPSGSGFRLNSVLAEATLTNCIGARPAQRL